MTLFSLIMLSIVCTFHIPDLHRALGRRGRRKRPASGWPGSIPERCTPSTPERLGSGLLSRSETVRLRPTARHDIQRRDGLMASRLFREQEIAGSTPAAPTARLVYRLDAGPTHRPGGFDSRTSYGGVAQRQCSCLMSDRREVRLLPPLPLFPFRGSPAKTSWL